ncbi:MAG: hypothetical protein V3V96_15340 [Acidiferrobacterales bacterium]
MALSVNITISDEDVSYLENDLLDIQNWVEKAVTGKINQSKKRFIREWQAKLMADPDVTSMPADTDSFITLVKARLDYKNRVARDAADAAR